MYEVFIFNLEEKTREQRDNNEGSSENTCKDSDEEESYEYDLIGVTVHTGTADGGHYYSFIRDRVRDKWFLFNDAEVKPFDPKQIAAECFGGEMTVSSNFTVREGYKSVLKLISL